MADKLIIREELAAASVSGQRLAPVSPGEVLLEEFMRPLGLSARALAAELGVPPNRIAAIINGQRGVSAETAILLGERFGTTAEFWLNLQSAHDLELAGYLRGYAIREVSGELRRHAHGADPAEMAARLGRPEPRIRSALARLRQDGSAQERQGRWYPTAQGG
jgi:antitoxin HigA-1